MRQCEWGSQSAMMEFGEQRLLTEQHKAVSAVMGRHSLVRVIAVYVCELMSESMKHKKRTLLLV